MTRSLVFKLTIAFWLVSLIGVALVAFFAVRATSNEFDTLQDDRMRQTLVDRLAGYYATTGSWDGAERALQRLMQDMQTPFAVADLNQDVVLPGPGFPMDRHLPLQMVENGTPIEVDGQVVGVLLMPEIMPRIIGRDCIMMLTVITCMNLPDQMKILA